MNQPETMEPSADTSVIKPAAESRVSVSPTQPSRAATCPTCGTSPAGVPPNTSFVYALGRIEPRFPRASVEKEFAQVTGREKTAGLTDRQVLHAVLSKRENRYLARQLCWVLSIEGLETYLLHPRDLADYELLIEAVRAAPNPADMDLVVGLRGPIAPPDMCNGVMVPIVMFDQLYSFDRESLIKSIPKPETAGKDFAMAAEEVLDRIMQMADNAGATDEHRALNYLAVRYPAIYAKAYEQFAANSSLTAVEVRPSALAGTRRIVDAIFAYTDRTTDVIEKFSVRVDVTEEFPFLVTKLSPYYDHR